MTDILCKNTMNATTSELADILSISRRRLDELSADGIIPKKERNTYILKESIHAFIRFREEEIRSELPTGSGDADERFREARADLYEQRAREQKRRADLIEGTSFDGAAVVHVIGAMLAASRARILSLPNASAASVAEVSDPESCRQILSDACRDALAEIASFDPAAIVKRFRDQSGQHASPSIEAEE